MTIFASEVDFRAARQRLESKPKSAGEEVTTLEDAVSRIADGSHVAFGGCLYSRTPLALIWALLRRHPRRLTISRNLMCYEGKWCMVAGALDKVVTSWMAIGLPWGLSRIVREYVESGRVPLEEWSQRQSRDLGLPYRAAAMGVPFVPALTMLGSDYGGRGFDDGDVSVYRGNSPRGAGALSGCSPSACSLGRPLLRQTLS